MFEHTKILLRKAECSLKFTNWANQLSEPGRISDKSVLKRPDDQSKINPKAFNDPTYDGMQLRPRL